MYMDLLTFSEDMFYMTTLVAILMKIDWCNWNQLPYQNFFNNL